MEFTNLLEIKKAYIEGIYSDTPANRKLGRVGMSYKEWENRNKEDNNKDLNFENWNFLFPLDKIQQKYGFIVYPPNATEKDAFSLGGISFLKGKLWKLAILMGLNEHSLSWVGGNKISLSTLLDNENKKRKIKKWLDKLDINYLKDSLSNQNWNEYITISTSKENIEKIDKIYNEFYLKWKGFRRELKNK